MAHKCVTNYTFEFEPVGKSEEACLEIRVHFDYTPGTPESGRYSGPPENYDPGSGCEIAYDYAEREVVNDYGKRVFERVKTGEWLDEHCRAWLATQDESDLENDLPDNGPDPDDRRDEMMERNREMKN